MATRTLSIAQDTVLVCRGSDCRRDPDHRKLCQVLDDAGAPMRMVGCLGMCDGPAVAMQVGDRFEFIGNIRGSAVRNDIVALTAGATKPSRRLRKRMLKRSKRTKAKRKLDKRLKHIDD